MGLQKANAFLRKQSHDEDTTKVILTGGLVVAMLVAGMLYAWVSRLKKQNAYHMSSIVKLNVDRIACMEKVRGLTKPILEESANRSQARIACTGGMETD